MIIMAYIYECEWYWFMADRFENGPTERFYRGVLTVYTSPGALRYRPIPA